MQSEGFKLPIVAPIITVFEMQSNLMIRECVNNDVVTRCRVQMSTIISRNLVGGRGKSVVKIADRAG